MILALILLQGIVTDPKAATQPLRNAVVDAIRNCPHSKDDEVAVCAPDRGFAERYRVPKLTKPQVDFGGPKITLGGGNASDGSGQSGCNDNGSIQSLTCPPRNSDDWVAQKRRAQAMQKPKP